ncbi:unnamed protein product [Gordionus sp. m RMFG-2023]
MEDLKYYVDKTVHKFIGFDEPALGKAIINCINNGLDKYETSKKLTTFLDEGKALKLANKIFNMMSDSKLFDPAFKPSKRQKLDEELSQKDIIDALDNEAKQSLLSNTIMNEDQIKEIMANAQKNIEARKQQLQLLQQNMGNSVTTNNNVTPLTSSNRALNLSDAEKALKAAELHARIQSAFATKPILSTAMENTNLDVNMQATNTKPTPLILDEYGRTVDSSGKTIQIAQPMPTLKANIRARKREEFKIAIQEKPTDEVNTLGKFFDPRLPIAGPSGTSGPTSRNARHTRAKAFKFYEKGKFEQMAQKLRAKARLEQLQNEISQAVKKTGIISAAKLALMIPKKDPGSTKDIPQCEWWDSMLLKRENYDSILPFQNFSFGCLEQNRITNLIQHPMQMKRQRMKKYNTEIVVLLTKKERKKLRRQNRREIWLEKQEKIRLGLEPPPEPKLKITNLMRVLGKEAILDPTKIEGHVRAQMAKRAKTHEDANAERKLTPDERRAKKERKIKEDTSDEVHVAVFRVKSLHNPAKKFKVEANANQMFMTGFVALYKDVNVIVVEGGPKQIRKFKHLVLDRIKWGDDKLPSYVSNNPSTFFVSGGQDSSKENNLNRCDLIWEGIVKRRSFGPLTFKIFPSEPFAREAFTKHGVEQYWNLAFSRALLENNDDLANN